MPQPPPPPPPQQPPPQLDVPALEEALGFCIVDAALYEQAFTHRSVAGKPSYERLEFLGDAVLNVIVADYLFEVFPDADEGFLTQARNNLVSNKTLAYLARRLGLERFVRVGEVQGRRCRISPRILEDVFEALVASVRKDLGAACARAFVLDVLRRYVSWDHVLADTNYKSQLAIMAKRQQWDPQYVVVQEPDLVAGTRVHVVRAEAPPYGAWAEGAGRGKKEAEQRAAQALLGLLRGGHVRVQLDQRHQLTRRHTRS